MFSFAAYPDVVVKDITPDHEFIVLACDGIWDVLTNQEVVDFVRIRLGQKMEPEIVSDGQLLSHGRPQKFNFSRVCGVGGGSKHNGSS